MTDCPVCGDPIRPTGRPGAPAKTCGHAECVKTQYRRHWRERHQKPDTADECAKCGAERAPKSKWCEACNALIDSVCLRWAASDSPTDPEEICAMLDIDKPQLDYRVGLKRRRAEKHVVSHAT